MVERNSGRALYGSPDDGAPAVDPAQRATRDPGRGSLGLGAATASAIARARVSRRTLFTVGGLSIIGIGAAPARASVATSAPAVRGYVPRAVLDRGLRADGSQVQTSPQYYVDEGPDVIALTVDDGPDSEYTPQVLALLRKYGILASFCMIGNQVADDPDMVSQVAADGHMICNHTWDHPDLTRLSADAVSDQIERTTEALGKVGITPTVFRAPYGNWNSTVFEACAAADLRPLDWSVDPMDWSMPGVDSIVDNIMANTKTGSIILEHDGGGDRSQTVAALSIVLPRLLDAGYSFTTV
jgi:peptidoglycan-N-acetylglucosamine deacetylase